MQPTCEKCHHVLSDHSAQGNCWGKDCDCKRFVSLEEAMAQKDTKNPQNGAQSLPEVPGAGSQSYIMAKLNSINERVEEYGLPYHFGIVIDQNGRLTDVDLFPVPAKPMTEAQQRDTLTEYERLVTANCVEINQILKPLGYELRLTTSRPDGRIKHIQLVALAGNPENLLKEEKKVRPGAKKCANCGEFIQFASMLMSSNIWTGWVHLNGGIDCDHYNHGRIGAMGQPFYVAARPED